MKMDNKEMKDYNSLVEVPGMSKADSKLMRFHSCLDEQFEDDYPKPENFDKMLEIAHELSKDFPFVRVDLYNIGGKIYFGELTFYPWTGYVQFTPDSFDFELGSYFTEY